MTENSLNLLKKNYFRSNESNWSDLCKRVSRSIANAEEVNSADWAQKFYHMMNNMDFVPSSPCLMNAGTKNQQLSSCFIISIDDNIESIYNAKAEMAKIFQKNGGVGFNISALRPAKSVVQTSKGYSCGAIGFMEEFDLTADIITRNNARKGAIKVDLNDWHPDIFEFVSCKDSLNKFNRMNISVSMSDKFMNAVKNNSDWELKFPDYENMDKELYHSKWHGDMDLWEESGYPVKIYQTVKAKELYNTIMEHAWKTGEPGVSFRDVMDKDNPNPHLGKINSTNPCAEFCSIPYNSCNLGSINLSNFVENKQINYDKLKETIHNAVRFLDDMITVNVLPIDKINKVTKSVRSVGLGTMGFADMLYKMNITYGNKECENLIDNLYSFIRNEAQKESIKLAKEKGTYAAYKGSKWDKNNILVRNSNFISIAPNGSISFITNTSGGIEPNFALVYTRLTNDGTKYFVVNPVLEEWLKQHDMYDDEILNKIVENNGKRIKEIPEYFVTAQDISPDIHVDVVSQVQKYVDLSVSKTVNLPNNATVNDVSDIYMKAWKSGVKGITIYRDGSRENQTLSTSTNNNKEEIQKVKKEEIPRGVIIDADDNVIGLKRKLTTGCGSLHCEAFFDPVSGDLLETYFNKGSTGGCVSGDTEYFNGKEWKPISQYIKGEKVLQYNKDGTANLVEPLNYIVNDNVKTLKHFTNKYFEMMLSNDHRMYLYTNYRKYDMGIRKELHDEIITVDDWINNGKKERHVPTTFKLYGNGIQLTDEEIRVCVMVYADGHICNKQSQYISVEVSKDRKKKRTRELLKNANIPYKEFEYDYKPNYISFKFYPTDRLLNWISDKQFTSKWYQVNKHQMEIIADEIMYWDGSVGKGNRIGEYYSSKKEEIDFIQFILAALGYRGVISYNGKKTSYRVRVTNLSNLDISHTTIKDEPTLDNKSYCFTVPSSMLVLRYKNNIFITGNCNQFMIGLSRTISLLCRAGVDINTIIEQLNSCGVCPSYATRTATKHDTSKGACCPMAIGNALLDMYKEMQDRLFDNDSEQIDVVKTTKLKSLCPECGEPLIFEGGCNICKSCGWSKCN